MINSSRVPTCEIVQPIKASYPCEHCGEHDHDTKQVIRTNCAGRMALFHVSERMLDTAEQKAEKR